MKNKNMKKVAVLRSSKNEELMKEIKEKLDENVESVHLSVRPTVNIIASILSFAPNLKEITCPPSLYLRTPEKIKEALEKVNVSFKPLKLTPGRPRTHSNNAIDEIRKLSEKYSAKEISKKLKIPLTTVYYYLNKEKKE